MAVYYYDTDAGGLTVGLARKGVSNNNGVWIGVSIVTSSGSSGRGSEVATNINEQIDNQTNSYWLIGDNTASNRSIENIVIEYTVSGP